MHRLGHTRSSRKGSHLVQTPDTFVRAPLPGMRKATAIVHAGPALGAAFTEYTAEFDSGGRLGATAAQRFVYVLDGELAVLADGKEHLLTAAHYAYAPAGSTAVWIAANAARAVVIEKPYRPVTPAEPPAFFVGDEQSIAAQPLNGDPALLVRPLVPDDWAFDFAVNTMTYEPGAALPMVEIHIMEHGLLMLAGGGIYRLGDDWYPVTAGDFVWMAPYCPQWYGALGKVPSKYLIYKDWNRHPLD